MQLHAILAAAAIGAILSLTPAAFADDQSLGNGLVVRQAGDVSYVSGGIGDAQQDALKSASDRFNLKLTMATHDGKYIGKAKVRIADKQGNQLIDTASEGPLFLANLPAGSYHVEATAGGKSLERDVTVSADGQQQVVLTWPRAAGDADMETLPQ